MVLNEIKTENGYSYTYSPYHEVVKVRLSPKEYEYLEKFMDSVLSRLLLKTWCMTISITGAKLKGNKENVDEFYKSKYYIRV